MAEEEFIIFSNETSLFFENKIEVHNETTKKRTSGINMVISP
jgi:hypothetical protein